MENWHFHSNIIQHTRNTSISTPVRNSLTQNTILRPKSNVNSMKIKESEIFGRIHCDLNVEKKISASVLGMLGRPQFVKECAQRRVKKEMDKTSSIRKRYLMTELDDIPINHSFFFYQIYRPF